MEKEIRMPLSEYLELVNKNEVLSKAVIGLGEIAIVKTCGFFENNEFHYNYNLLSENEVIRLLKNDNDRLEHEVTHLQQRLLSKANLKKWWQF